MVGPFTKAGRGTGGVAKQWAARIAEVAAGLTALADRLPPLLEGKAQADMRHIIDGEAWRMRDHYARKGKFCPAPESDV